ncbi:MAG: hypothetical protein DHS20C20_28300 [Ardenticatenaceae bacterium]|nr:MAG: hypothetical protein DHS20C20_28300 [Ardenticatenaceae bacterium]
MMALRVKSKRDRRIRGNGRLLFLAGFLLIILALFTWLRYHPALLAAPGFTLHNITEPGWLNGRVKSVQAIAEITPCTYTLLGWQDETHFYYEAECGQRSQLWRYTIATEQLEKATATPNDLYAEAVPAENVTEAVLANVYPRELATVSREVFIEGDVFPSLDGRFTALISRHIYGPQDVLLISPESFSPETR